MESLRLPYVIALNCLENSAKEMAAALADLCVFEHVGLVEGMLEKIAAASIVVLPSVQYLPRAAQRKLSPSQLILCVGAGPDMRAVESSVAEEIGLRVYHVDVPRSDEVADTVMALILGVMRKTHTLAAQGCTSASWHGGFRDAWAGMRRLKGLTLGLVGVNAAGRAVARRAAAFGLKVVYCDLESELLGADVMEAKRKGKVRKALTQLGKGMMTLRQTVEHADIVSLHCSLKDDTLHLINDKTIAYFKKGAVLVNASSCHLVSDAALKRALQSGHLSCCALDGVEGPQWMEAWVREFPNVLILPRSADQSTEGWAELGQKVAYVLRRFLTEGRVPSDAVVAEDLEAEEAAWAALGLPAANPTPSAASAGGSKSSTPEKESNRTVSGGGVSRPSTGTGTSAGGVSASAAQSRTQGGGNSLQVGDAGDAVRSTSGGTAQPLSSAAGDVPQLSAERSVKGGKGGLAKERSLPSGSKERVSFGEVEIIQPADAEVSPTGYAEAMERIGSFSGELPHTFRGGMLTALRAPDPADPARSGLFYAAQRTKPGPAPFEFAVSPESSQSSPEAQFVMMCDKETIGFRSVHADGRYLQTSKSGELQFASKDMDEAASWHYSYAAETSRLSLVNLQYPKVTLDVVLELLT